MNSQAYRNLLQLAGLGPWTFRARRSWLLAAIISLVSIESRAARSNFHADPDYLVDSWETEDGLPENSATAIVQTPDGYIWFGTFDGLVRFNGVEFTVFNSGNTPQLPSDGIVNLHLGKDGRLWISTYGGLVVRDGEQWRQLTRIDPRSSDYVRTFTERPNGDLLMAAFSEKLVEFSDGKFTELPTPPGVKGQGYLGGVDEDGHWWAVQDKFVGRFEDGRWVSMISPSNSPGTATGFGPARDGGMWLVLGNELRRLRRGVEVARVTLSEPPGSVWSLSEDSQGNVWIATFDAGVCRVTPDGTMRRWSAANGGSDQGRSVFEDRERNLWFGTSGDGLMRFVPRRFQFFDLHGGHGGLSVQSVWPDSTGGLWAGTFGRGLFHFAQSGVTNVTLPVQAIGTAYVKSVLADRAGRLWVGTMGDAVWLLESGGARHLPGTQTGGQNVHALFEDSRGRIWVSGGSGIAVFDGNDSQGFGPDQGLPVSTVTGFAEDSSGAIWLSNGNGVFHREREQNLAEVKDAAGQPIRGIGCLLADREGAIWLGSSDRGLMRWKDGRLVVLGGQSGLPVSAVRGLVNDNDGFFWMTSVRSVVRARLSDLQAMADGQVTRLAFQVFDASDGLPNGEFTGGRQPTCALDATGRLWFAMTKGVAMTEPATLRLNDAPPPVHVEGISFYRPASPPTNHSVAGNRREEVLTNLRGPFASPVSLPAGSRRIEVHYAGLSFVAPEKVRYQIRLDSQDEDWQDIGSRRVAYYYDLPPGDYKFQVGAANNDGVWNETGASLAFTVQPFFWQRGWFWLLVGATALGGVGGGVWRIMRTKLRRHEEHLAHEREIRQAREQLSHLTRVTILGELSGSLAHELNQPLTAILSNAQAALRFLKAEAVDLDELREILKDIVEDDQRAGEVIRRLRGLLKRGEVQLQLLDLNEVARETLKLVHSDLVTRNVILLAEFDPRLPTVNGDRVQLQQVLLNLILNGCDAMAEQAPHERKLTFRTGLTDSAGVEVSVMDRGHGIPPEQIGRIFEPFITTKRHGLGLGLAISRNIVQAHGGRLQATNNPKGGAKFSFVLPRHDEGKA